MTSTIDEITKDIEGHCHSGSGVEFPNAYVMRMLAGEIKKLQHEAERLRADRDALMGVLEPLLGVDKPFNKAMCDANSVYARIEGIINARHDHVP